MQNFNRLASNLSEFNLSKVSPISHTVNLAQSLASAGYNEFCELFVVPAKWAAPRVDCLIIPFARTSSLHSGIMLHIRIVFLSVYIAHTHCAPRIPNGMQSHSRNGGTIYNKSHKKSVNYTTFKQTQNSTWGRRQGGGKDEGDGEEELRAHA